MASNRIKIKRNLKLLPAYRFLKSFRMVSFIQILYLSEILGSYTSAMSIFAIFSFVVTIAEVPTGMISDKLGRVKSLSLASLFRFLAVLSLVASYYFNPWVFSILYAVLVGIGVSFGSGTEEAISFETVKQLKKEKLYPEFFGKVSSMGPLSLSLAALLGGFLAHKYSYYFVVAFDLIPLFASLMVSLLLVEPDDINLARNKKSGKNIYKGDLFKAIKNFKNNRKLQLISYSTVIKKGINDSIYQFENLYFESIAPMWVVGLVRFIRQVLGSIAFWFSGKILNKYGDKKVLFTTEIGIFIVKLISILLNFIATPFIYVSTNLFTSVGTSSLNNLSQKEFSNDQRATMGSLVSLLSNFVTGLFCLLSGGLADLVGLKMAMIILVIPSLFILPLYNNIFKKNKNKKAA